MSMVDQRVHYRWIITITTTHTYMQPIYMVSYHMYNVIQSPMYMFPIILYNTRVPTDNKLHMANVLFIDSLIIPVQTIQGKISG